MKRLAMIELIPVLQIRHSDGTGWTVAAIWPDGRSEEIKSFKSEAGANEWIARSFTAWLDNREAEKATAGASARHLNP